MFTKEGKVQIGIYMLHVMYHFTEEDTIYCKVVSDESKTFKAGYEFITHYKSLIV